MMNWLLNYTQIFTIEQLYINPHRIIIMRQRIQQFKKILRKEQLQKEFNHMRKLLTQAIEEQHTQDPNAGLSKQFQLILDHITKAIHQQKSQVALQFFDRLIKVIEVNTNASTCLFIHSLKVSQLIQLILRNELVKENKFRYKLLSPEMEMQMTDCILTVLSKINYTALDQDTYFNILKSFWLVLTLKHINIESNQGLHLLQKTILIIIKMMNPPNEIVYSYLTELGLGSKIVEFIEDIRLVQKDRFCELFSEMIFLYMQQQNMFSKQKGCQINGVHILGMQSNEKEHLLAFCIGLLASDKPKILQNSLTAIANILTRFEYFSHSIPWQKVQRVCQLMDSPNRNIQLQCLQILDIMVLMSAQPTIKLIENMVLLDKVQKQLRRQLQHRDNLTGIIVQRCANLMCNSTCEREIKTKRKIYQHSVWQLAFNNLHLDSCLFPLIVVFQYLFQILPREKLMVFAECYIVAVSELEMSLVQKKYKEKIRQTLLRVFYTIRDFYPQGMLQKYASLVESNGLREFLAEEIDALMTSQV